MSEPLFDIVFRGDLVPGHQLLDVKARLAQLFQVDLTKVDALFTGAAVALKRNLDQATAVKYQAALQRAGAAVELRRVASENSAVAAPSKPSPELGFTLAPVGADLLAPSERSAISAPVLDLADYSIKPMEGYLLDEAEKTVIPPMPELNVDFDLAPAGADLLEASGEEEHVQEINVHFDLAEVGEDLLKPEEKPQHKPVQVRTDHLSLS